MSTADKNAAAKAELAKKKDHEEKVDKEVQKDLKASEVPKSETAAKADAEATVNAQEAEKAKSQTTESLVSGLVPHVSDPHWLMDDQGRRVNVNDVKFNVKYGSSFKGEKHMPEGITVVSQEVAEQFESLGIGHIVK